MKYCLLVYGQNSKIWLRKHATKQTKIQDINKYISRYLVASDYGSTQLLQLESCSVIVAVSMTSQVPICIIIIVKMLSCTLNLICLAKINGKYGLKLNMRKLI